MGSFCEFRVEEYGRTSFAYFGDGNSSFQVTYDKDGERRVHSPYGSIPQEDLEGQNAPARVPFRLPEIRTANRFTTVYVAENEELANALAREGLVATTCPLGLCWWNTGWGEKYFKNRPVVILFADNEASRKAVGIVADDLKGYAASVVRLNLEQCFDEGALLKRLREADAIPELQRLSAEALRHSSSGGVCFIDPSEWHGRPPPDREWMWFQWLPFRQATLFTGAGASGKSLLGQQLATCVALGSDCLGIPVMRTNAMYITSEDDADELHRRQSDICRLLGVPMSELRGKLLLSSWQGKDGNELATFGKDGRLVPTDRYHYIVEEARLAGVRFIVLDNKAHLFGGNENDRNQVAQFVNLLNGLATDVDGAVMFLAHPNKNGDQWSGSTAWEDQVRSRLFLSVQKDEKDQALNPDARVLRRGKANYARLGEEVAFYWHRGAFVRPEDLPDGEGAVMAAQLLADEEDERFLECLAKTMAERRSVSLHPAAPNYAARVFQKMPTAKRMKAKNFEAAMHRLLDAGTIVGDQRLWQRDNRSWVRGLGLAPSDAQTAHEAVHEPA